MATLTASYSYIPATPEGEASVEYYVRATVTYSVVTTNTDVTVTVSNVQTGDSKMRNEPVVVTLGGVTIGSWKMSGISTKTINQSKTQGRTHSGSSISLTVSIGDPNYTTLYDKSSVSISVPARPSYAVTYSANGGSYAPSAQTKWYNESLKLSASRPTRSGYAFWHWNTSSTNAGTTYQPEATYTANAALSLYAIWNPIVSFNGQGGSNVPASQTKTYGASLTLPTNVPVRAGYQFLKWNTKSDGTGTSYSPGGTFASNSATTLYAIWQRVAQAPTISSISVVRCDSGGNADDAGEYARLSAQWSVDTSAEAGMSSNVGTVTGSIRESGTSTSRAIAFSSGSGGTGGTAVAIVPDCDTDTQYTVTVTVTNSVAGAGQSSALSTSRSDILTRAFFTMDFAAGGRGIGMGVAAPAEGFECGFDAQFDGDVEVLGDLSAPNLTLAREQGEDVATASNNWALQGGSYGYRYGPMAMVSLYVTTNAALSAGTTYTVGTIATEYRPAAPVGFSNHLGHGYISYGTVYFRPTEAIGANTGMYISSMHFC